MCDLRICGEASRFGVPIKSLGLTMGYGELQGVLGLVGRAVTSEILLEGRVFDAAEALQKRLVNRVVRDADVERETYALAERIAAGAPLVARWHKQFIDRLSVTPRISAAEWNEGFACFDTEDYRIGVKAFLQKTKPQFKGK
jgi:enoyl-CoA hydratase/carnithine racemase